MENSNIKQLQLEDLIIVRDELRERIKKLDPKNIAHRKLVIKAIKTYIDKFITPAMYLAYDENGERVYLIDVEDVMEEGFEQGGLDVFFSLEKKDFNRPSDEEIDRLFQKLSLKNRTPHAYENFWKAWCVVEAESCVRKLCNFLNDALIPTKDKNIPADVLLKEIEQIEEILKMPMVNVYSYIDTLLEWERKALSVWTEKTENNALSEA